MRRMAWILAALAGVFPFSGAREAAASGFMVRENSAESVATVYAGNASRADDVSTVFNNPAGMSDLGGTQIEIGSAVVFPNMHFTGNATIMGTPIPADNSREVGQIAGIPHVYGVIDINDRLKAGIAITVPFGNTVDNSEAWSGRYVSIRTAVITADINPNISYKVTDNFSVGAGFSAQYFQGNLSSAIPQFLLFGPGTPDAIYHLRVDDWAWGYNFGALWEPMQGTRLGVTYRSGIDHTLTGRLNFSPTTNPLLGLTSQPASTDVSVPASITGSVTHQLTPALSLSSDVQFTQWDTFDKLNISSPPNPTFTFNEHYRDSWMISVGGVYNLSRLWTLRGGIGWDESPVLDAFRSTGVPDKDRIMLGVGTGYHFSDASSLDVGYSHYFAAGHASMNSSANAIDPLTGAVILHGTYNNSLDYLVVTYRQAF
jgi:long-chain fatty acid transport protein